MAVRRVAKKPVKKVNGVVKKSPVKKPPAKVVMVRLQMDVMVSVGEADERSFEEFRDAAVDQTKAFLTDPEGPVRAKDATSMSATGYYLVNGRVCLPDDYDPATRDFKPGTHPPLWAMSPDEQKIVQRIDREKSRPEIARQPQHLRTSTETDEYHELLKRDPEAAAEHRRNEVRKSLEGIERRSQIVEEIEDVDDDIEDFEDEIEDIEEEWEEGEEFDEDAADEVVAASSVSVLARLRAKKKVSRR